MDAFESSGAASPGKSNAISRVVGLRHLLRRWRDRACRSSSGAPPADVPSGHVAVHVGSRRFVVRAAHLNHPAFRALLALAEEEYGFAPRSGPISIPCDEALFEDVLQQLVREEEGEDEGEGSGSSRRRMCRVAGRAARRRCKSSPLLRSLLGEESASPNSVW